MIFSAIDLFCGAGGLSQGLKQAGFSVFAAVDDNKPTSETYALNHPDTNLVICDIREADPKEISGAGYQKPGSLDLLAGCPPCQGFSELRTLRRKNCIQDPSKDLIFEYLRFVKVLLPKTLLMENVPGLADDSRFRRFLHQLKLLGYRYAYDVLDAADHGVPQRRRRLVMIASRHGIVKLAPKLNSISVRDAIGGIRPPGHGIDPLHDYQETRSPKVRKLIQRIPKDGGSRRDLPFEDQLPCHQRTDGFYDVYGRMSWDSPAPTITTGCINPSKGRFLHPEQNRAVTLREAALLQGFPHDYLFDLSRGRYKVAEMIGNAFPPAFAQAHAACLFDHVKATHTRDQKKSA